jgi:hypothetical protein
MRRCAAGPTEDIDFVRRGRPARPHGGGAREGARPLARPRRTRAVKRRRR